MSHYDYWSDRVRRSILLEAGADLISYGMGERSIVEIADALASGMDVRDITMRQLLESNGPDQIWVVGI
jgi:radical SAM superfamily enzyme YgiQ (UPF0313 family)